MTDTTTSVAPSEVDAAGFLAALTANVPLVLVDYFADHCVWCDRLEPILSAVAPLYWNRVHMVKVNVQRYPQTLPDGGLRATPTIALYRQGKLVMSKSGMMQRPSLIAFLDHWLDPANEGLTVV